MDDPDLAGMNDAPVQMASPLEALFARSLRPQESKRIFETLLHSMKPIDESSMLYLAADSGDAVFLALVEAAAAADLSTDAPSADKAAAQRSRHPVAVKVVFNHLLPSSKERAAASRREFEVTAGLPFHRNLVRVLCEGAAPLPPWMLRCLPRPDLVCIKLPDDDGQGVGVAGAGPAGDGLEVPGRVGAALPQLQPREAYFLCTENLSTPLRSKLASMEAGQGDDRVPLLLPLPLLMAWCSDIAEGMLHLERHGVVLTDLQLDSLMWDAKGGVEGEGAGVGRVVIAELGSCCPSVQAPSAGDAQATASGAIAPAAAAAQGSSHASASGGAALSADNHGRREWGEGALSHCCPEVLDELAQRKAAGSSGGDTTTIPYGKQPSWQLGLQLYGLATGGFHPYGDSGASPGQLPDGTAVPPGHLQRVLESYEGPLNREDRLDERPSWFVKLVLGLLQANPAKRLSVSEAAAVLRRRRAGHVMQVRDKRLVEATAAAAGAQNPGQHPRQQRDVTLYHGTSTKIERELLEKLGAIPFSAAGLEMLTSSEMAASGASEAGERGYHRRRVKSGIRFSVHRAEQLLRHESGSTAWNAVLSVMQQAGVAGVPSSRSGPRMAFGWAGPRISDRSGLKFTAGASVYLAAVHEYLCAELEELCGNEMNGLPSEYAEKAEGEGEGACPLPVPPSIALSAIKEDAELLKTFSPLGGLDAGFQLMAPCHRRLELIPEQELTGISSKASESSGGKGGQKGHALTPVQPSSILAEESATDVWQRRRDRLGLSDSDTEAGGRDEWDKEDQAASGLSSPASSKDAIGNVYPCSVLQMATVALARSVDRHAEASRSGIEVHLDEMAGAVLGRGRSRSRPMRLVGATRVTRGPLSYELRPQDGHDRPPVDALERQVEASLNGLLAAVLRNAVTCVEYSRCLRLRWQDVAHAAVLHAASVVNLREDRGAWDARRDLVLFRKAATNARRRSNGRPSAAAAMGSEMSFDRRSDIAELEQAMEASSREPPPGQKSYAASMEALRVLMQSGVGRIGRRMGRACMLALRVLRHATVTPGPHKGGPQEAGVLDLIGPCDRAEARALDEEAVREVRQREKGMVDEERSQSGSLLRCPGGGVFTLRTKECKFGRARARRRLGLAQQIIEYCAGRSGASECEGPGLEAVALSGVESGGSAGDAAQHPTDESCPSADIEYATLSLLPLRATVEALRRSYRSVTQKYHSSVTISTPALVCLHAVICVAVDEIGKASVEQARAQCRQHVDHETIADARRNGRLGLSQWKAPLERWLGYVLEKLEQSTEMEKAAVSSDGQDSTKAGTAAGTSRADCASAGLLSAENGMPGTPSGGILVPDTAHGWVRGALDGLVSEDDVRACSDPRCWTMVRVPAGRDKGSYAVRIPSMRGGPASGPCLLVQVLPRPSLDAPQKVLLRSVAGLDATLAAYWQVFGDVHSPIQARIGKIGMTPILSFIQSIVNQTGRHLAATAVWLAVQCGRKTVSSREVQTAVRLFLAGELAPHAVREGTKGITKFCNS